MTSVEDILRGLTLLVANNTIRDNWLTNFVGNVASHLNNGNALSTKQGEIICKNASNHLSSLAKVMRLSRDEVSAAIANPRFNKTPYQSTNVPREVRYIGMNKLAFRFKRDPTVLSDLRNLAVKQHFINPKSLLGANATWNQEQRIWMVPVVAENLEEVFNLIRRHKFNFDTETAEYLTLCTNSLKQPSTVVMDDEEETVYVNVCNNPLLAHIVYNLMNGQAV